MISKSNSDTLATKANAAFDLVAQDVIVRARAAKTEVVVWRDGKIAKLSPEQADRELAEHAAKTRAESAE